MMNGPLVITPVLQPQPSVSDVPEVAAQMERVLASLRHLQALEDTVQQFAPPPRLSDSDSNSDTDDSAADVAYRRLQLDKAMRQQAMAETAADLILTVAAHVRDTAAGIVRRAESARKRIAQQDVRFLRFSEVLLAKTQYRLCAGATVG